MRHTLLIGSLSGLFPLVGKTQQSDLVSWNWVSVRLQPDSSRWSVEASPNYVAYHNLTCTFLRVGLGRITYVWPHQQLAASFVYAMGPVDQQGITHTIQLQVGQAQPAWALRSRWQLTLDRLWLSPALYEGQWRYPVYRLRTLAGIVPRLSPHLSLVVNTEPFLYRTNFWFKEVRSQAGVQWQPSARGTLQVLYWNWWAGYKPRRVRCQHTILLTATFLLTKTNRPVNRPLP